MHNQNCFPRQRWSVPKDQERNFVAAFFHMATIALTCTSLAQLGWFRVRGSVCAPHLAVYQFFSSGYPSGPERDFGTFNEFSPSVTIQYYPKKDTPQCMNQQIANLMRTIILLCFLAMSSSLFGFFLDIIGPTSKILRVVRKNAMPSIFTVICVVVVIGLCYYITTLLQKLIQNSNPEREVKVSYEYGCYTITAAGVVAVFATASNLLQYYAPLEEPDRQRIFDEWDGMETFSVGGGGAGWIRGTPLENIPPPPPYTP